MASAALSDARYPWLEETIAAVEANRRPDGSVNIQGVATELGLQRSTAQGRIGTAERYIAAEKQSQQRYFEAPKLPVKERSIGEIRAHRRAESIRAREYEEAIKLIPIKINTPGPIGVMFVGDPHIDNPGSDWALFEDHMALAAKRAPYVFCINVGDVRDNWVGRLTRLFADHTISAKESWRLAEWTFRESGVSWLALVLGNHDCWSGDNDPLQWIAGAADVGVTQAHGTRLALNHPNSAETRIHTRHDFQGNSIFNPLHALKRETLHGHRDHVIVAGHRHMGADARDVNGDGVVFAMVRVAGYKISDSYAHQIGAHPRHIHPSALVIIDPDKPEGHSARVWTAPDIDTGMEFLDFLRKRYERKRA